MKILTNIRKKIEEWKWTKKVGKWIKSQAIPAFVIGVVTGWVVNYINNCSGSYSYIPYVTFKSSNNQSFRLSKEVATLEYSVGGKKWRRLGTQDIVFGGNDGDLRIRGKSKIGTNGATILFAGGGGCLLHW